jgi:hypothetical protein
MLLLLLLLLLLLHPPASCPLPRLILQGVPRPATLAHIQRFIQGVDRVLVRVLHVVGHVPPAPPTPPPYGTLPNIAMGTLLLLLLLLA